MEASVQPETDLLRIDAAKEVERIAENIRDVVLRRFRRKGAVLGVSGGIDSSVVAALCAHALGKDRVVALFMPESESDSESLSLGPRSHRQPGHPCSPGEYHSDSRWSRMLQASKPGNSQRHSRIRGRLQVQDLAAQSS